MPSSAGSVPSCFPIVARSLPRPSRLLAQNEPWRDAHASCPGQGFRARCGRSTPSRVPVRLFRGDARYRRDTRGWRGRSVRPRGSPTGVIESTHNGRSSPSSGDRPPHPRLRSSLPAPLCSARSRPGGRGGGISRCTSGFVTFQRAAFPHNPRNRGFLPFVAVRDSLNCSFAGGSLDSPPRHRLDRTPPENLNADDSCWDNNSAP